MITVSSKVEASPVAYNEEWKDDLADDENPITIEVQNWGRDGKFALLIVDGKRYAVIAGDLIRALTNATNTGG